MTLTFRAKLLASHLGLVIAILLLVVLRAEPHPRRRSGAAARRGSSSRRRARPQWVGEGRRHPDKLAGRIALIVSAEATIFDHDGNVLGDSSRPDVAAPPSGADAPEFGGAARRDGPRDARRGAA